MSAGHNVWSREMETELQLKLESTGTHTHTHTQLIGDSFAQHWRGKERGGGNHGSMHATVRPVRPSVNGDVRDRMKRQGKRHD